jgi:hypothetical protein
MTMTASEHIATYAEGWTQGDAAKILKGTAESYVFDDPNAGQITKAGFPGYLDGLKAVVEELRGGASHDQFMELSEVATQEDGGQVTVWCWWAIPGTDIAGSGLIKVGPEGVVSERIAYYTKLPG